MKNINIEVGAIYRLPNLSSQGGFRFYRCTANCLGALNQECVVCFEPLDKSPNLEIRVPRSMLWAMHELEKVSGSLESKPVRDGKR